MHFLASFVLQIFFFFFWSRETISNGPKMIPCSLYNLVHLETIIHSLHPTDSASSPLHLLYSALKQELSPPFALQTSQVKARNQTTASPNSKDIFKVMTKNEEPSIPQGHGERTQEQITTHYKQKYPSLIFILPKQVNSFRSYLFCFLPSS